MTADEKFTNAFRRMTNGWAIIRSFRQVGTAGMPYAKAVIALQHSDAVDYLSLSGELDKLIIGIKEVEDRQRLAAWVKEQMTNQAITNAQSSLDAASIVFGHSVLDAVLTEFIEITMITATEFWEKRIENKKIDLASLKSRGYEAVVSELLDNERQWLRRNASLVDKTSLLCSVCKPKSGKFNDGEYVFDEVKLKRLDKLRHDVVHGDLFGVMFEDVESNLKFFEDTAVYFFVTLNRAFKVRIDPSQMVASR